METLTPTLHTGKAKEIYFYSDIRTMSQTKTLFGKRRELEKADTLGWLPEQTGHPQHREKFCSMVTTGL